MDWLITAAARALATGDPLGALKRIALRDDPPALALRGIAMAQLGDLDRGRLLLRSAARAFGPREAVARARCIVAEAEIALARATSGGRPKRSKRRGRPSKRTATGQRRARRTASPPPAADRASSTRPSRRWPARSCTCRRPADSPSAELVARDRHAAPAHQAAREALPRAGPRPRRGIAALIAEVERAGARSHARSTPDARGEERPLLLDGCRDAAGVETPGRGRLPAGRARRAQVVSLATRPVLFALARALAEAWPGERRARHCSSPARSGPSRE